MRVVSETRLCVHGGRSALRGVLTSIACVALGCGPLERYRPGFLLEEPLAQPGKPPGAVAARRVGCLDVRVALACNDAVSPDFPLVAFTFGNRCAGAVPVDFTRLRVVGRMASDGGPADQALSAFDPAREIHPAILGAHAMAREILEYDATPRDATRGITQLCIDLEGLSNEGDRVDPVCLTRPVAACGRS
jgi:hypothetical protein